MTEEKNPVSGGRAVRPGMQENGLMSAFYGLAFIGGAVYYIQNATTFWEGVLGVVKALVWPGVLMYKVLELLKM